MLSGTGSLAYTFPLGGSVRPFVLAGAGVNHATASTSQDVTPDSESALNGGVHTGAGLRIGRGVLEVRYVQLKGFAPVGLRVGYGF